MLQSSWVVAVLLCAFALSHAGAARADGMRCGSKLVSRGDTLYDVRSVCGTPDASSQRVEYRIVRRYVSTPCFQDRGVVRCGYVEEQAVPITIDEWVYDFGPHNLVRYVIFEQGRLHDVTTGGYGTKEP